MIFRFHEPWFFLLIIPAIILFFVQWRRRPPVLVVSSVKHFTGKAGTETPKLGWLRLPLILEFLAVILLIIALARPQKGNEVISTSKNGIDIAFCLDVSGSMEYFDPTESQSYNEISEKIVNRTLKPRIEIAKQEIANFIDKRLNDRLSLIVFANQPFQICPLTFDKDLIKKSLAKTQTNMLGQYYNNGTGIAAPLATAVQRMKDSPAKRKVIILFTDGANNVDQALTPMQAAELAAEFNIIIYTVGIGSPNAVVLARDFFNNYALRKAPYEFNEELMKNMAKTTKGEYFHVADEGGFAEVMSQIDKLEKVEIKQLKQVNYKELYPLILYSGVFLLFLSYLLSKTIMMRLP